MESQKVRFKARGEMKELPQDIIGVILVRLPVKSLVRFKCVSKNWRSIISSARFIKDHLELSSKDKSLERHHIMSRKTLSEAEYSLLPSYLPEPGAAIGVHLDYATDVPYDYYTRIGSCNGLVCLLKDHFDFVLWNPSTRKFRELPSALDDPEVIFKFDDAYGFGFAESNDDYKVFFVWRFYPFDVRSNRLSMVYSLKADSWRKVEVPTMIGDKFTDPMGIFANGKLHWKLERNRSRIVSFDLENEICAIVEPPNGNGVLAGSIDGCLCCFSPSRSEPNRFDYWLLKGYGVKDSWYKFATLVRPRLGNAYDGDNDRVYFHPLFVGRNGEILGWCGSYLFIIYLKEDGRYSSPWLCDLNVFQPTTYVESLVEP